MTQRLRTLAVILALVSTFAPQMLMGLGLSDPCADEAADCSDCSGCIMPCGCCTVRVASLVAPAPLLVTHESESTVAALPCEPVLAAVDRDIFHPPRA